VKDSRSIYQRRQKRDVNVNNKEAPRKVQSIVRAHKRRAGLNEDTEGK